MNESHKMEPLFVWMLLPDPLCRLKGVDNVGEGGVRVGLVHEVVQHDESFHNGRLHVIELEPLLVLKKCNQMFNVTSSQAMELCLDVLSYERIGVPCP